MSDIRNNTREILPEPTLRRLPWYLAYVTMLNSREVEFVSSTQIAKDLNVDASQIAKDLSFLGIFLFMGMIGLILVGIVSMFFTFGSTFSSIVCLIGVLVFALFTAYDMQTLKNAYYTLSNGEQKDQLAVLGALHMYISFVAMFEYLLGLLNSRN